MASEKVRSRFTWPAWFHDQGFKTALIDADAQHSSSQWIAEVELGITVVTTDSPDDCLQKAQDALQSHDMVIGDCPGGLGDLSRTIVLLSDLALPPISPSILDLRSVQQATTILRYAQASTKWESKEGKQGKARGHT